jgi:hypothetical protein
MQLREDTRKPDALDPIENQHSNHPIKNSKAKKEKNMGMYNYCLFVVKLVKDRKEMRTMCKMMTLSSSETRFCHLK